MAPALILALERQEDLQKFEASLVLYSEFQASLGCRVKPCLKQTSTKRD